LDSAENGKNGHLSSVLSNLNLNPKNNELVKI